MSAALKDYIEKARAKGHDDDRIKSDLTNAGWDATMVARELGETDDLVIPTPPLPGDDVHQPKVDTVKVVPYRSTAGLEYLIMFLSLWIFSMSFAAVLHSAVDSLVGNTDSLYEGIVSFATASLVVSLPIFAYLFLKLKKQEEAKPDIRLDINRKNAVQVTLLVTFLIGIGKTIFYVYQLLNSGSGDNGSFVGNFLHTIITVGIAGSIFVYYWIDDHKTT